MTNQAISRPIFFGQPLRPHPELRSKQPRGELSCHPLRSKHQHFHKVLQDKHVHGLTGSEGTSPPCTRLGEADRLADLCGAV